MKFTEEKFATFLIKVQFSALIFEVQAWQSSVKFQFFIASTN